ncbi:DUF429 domain-containing protein [bacterium]|nr:DUF429 domain-containing protein [bacterium]
MITILGIDCAVDPRRRGIARGRLRDDRCLVDAAWRGDRCDLPALVGEARADGPVLLALDAPLGWPAALGAELEQHRAGAPIAATADAMFRRHTDRVVAARLGKTPLDVGADRIARTAHAALDQLAAVAAALGRPRVPLLWRPDRLRGVAAVEVYPAGLLVAAGATITTGYKPAAARAARSRLLTDLARELDLAPAVHEAAVDDADRLDAVLCVLAGWDVVRGLAPGPARGRERTVAGREGWIWVRDAVADGGRI